MPIITRKIELYLHHDDETDPDRTIYKSNWEYWHQVNDNLYKAANRIASHLFFNDEYENRLRIQHPRFKEIEKRLSQAKKMKLSDEEVSQLKAERKELYSLFRKQQKEFLGGSEQNSTYRVVSDEFLDKIHSNILTNLNQSIVKSYNEYRIDIAYGKRTLPNFKKGMPIPFSIKKENNLLIRKTSDGCFCLHWLNGIIWDFHFGRDRSNNREIVEQTVNGTYAACNSSIQQKGKKIFLNLVVDIPAKSNELDNERVIGVDLGINFPIYLACNSNMYGGKAIGSREEFLKVRNRMYAQMRELHRNLRTTTKGGKGRAQKLQALNRFVEKERNWVKTKNHLYSKHVIEYAKENKAGVIQMEGLGGFGKDKDDNVENGYKFILRNWSYSELQTLIENKALKEGIVVRYIDPYHTSQICSYCGHYEKGQRINQSTFICKNPDCEHGKGKKSASGEFEGINADWNAARNIALSNKIVNRNSKGKENK